MPRGLIMKDGTKWTIISEDLIEGRTNYAAAEWIREYDETHPLSVNLADSWFDSFYADDERIDKVVDDIINYCIDKEA